MMRILIVIWGLWAGTISAQEHGSIHGEGGPDSLWVWQAESQQWLTITEYWQWFAGQTGAKHWGSATGYPQYDQVNESDTLLLQLEQRPCLMQFFHAWWRHANDVQRWDDKYNHYGGCPYVFD